MTIPAGKGPAGKVNNKIGPEDILLLT